MCGRIALLTLLLTLALAGPSGALELRWASGEADLRLSGAARCTLVVRCTSTGEALPTDFRLLYAGESDSNSSLRVVANQPEGGIAGGCTLLDNLAPEDEVSRAQVVQLCGTQGEPRALAARFVLDIGGGFRGRLRLVPVTCPNGACPGAPVNVLEVSVNGGTDKPYPPMLLSVQGRLEGAMLTVAASGMGISRVERARLLRTSSDEAIPLAIVAKAETLLIAQAMLAGEFGGGWVEVADSMGAVGAAAVRLGLASPRPQPAGDYFLVRFRPNQVERPLGKDGGGVSEFSFSNGNLRQRLIDAGVLELEPVFPWFKPSDVRSENLIGEPVELEDLSEFYFARVLTGAEVATAVTVLRDDEGVHWVGPDYGGAAAQSHVVPDDPLFTANKQWGLRNLGPTLCGQTAVSGVDISATSGWHYTTGSPSVTIAVLDTGIDTTHTELTGHVRAGPAFVSPSVPTSFDGDPGRHGTAVAGIIAATGNNTNAMAGIAWHVVPWAIKVLRDTTRFSRASWVSQGISWATANSMPIICMAIGFPEASCSGGGDPILPDSANIMNVTCLNALYAGQLSVASMGNCDGPVKFWPAAFDKRVYGVGAEYFTGVRWEDCLISFALCGNCGFTNCLGSSFGPWIDAVAPGGQLIVTLAGGPNNVNDISPTCGPNNGFVGMAFGGTSASAGFAAGIAALLRSEESSLLGEDMANLLNIFAFHPAVPSQAHS